MYQAKMMYQTNLMYHANLMHLEKMTVNSVIHLFLKFMKMVMMKISLKSVQ